MLRIARAYKLLVPRAAEKGDRYGKISVYK